MTTFEIDPFNGALPLRFGMRPVDVHAILGEPMRRSTNSLGERVERFTGIRLSYDPENDGLCELSFSSSHRVCFGDIELFSTPVVVAYLSRHDASAVKGLGHVVFPSLGIALADFDSDQDSDRAVTVFAQGKWSDLSRFVPLGDSE